MKRVFNLVVGTLLIIAAAIGLVVSIAGVIAFGALQHQVVASITRQFTLLDQALAATDAGLETAASSVTQTQVMLASIAGTVDSSAAAIDDIVPSIQAMGVVVGDQLPATLEGAGNSLTSFAGTANIIDQLMRVLSAVPLINLPDYDPDVSLSESVTGFRDSLEGMPERLVDVQTGLEQTAGNLREIRGQVAGVGAAMSGLSETMDGMSGVVVSYQEIVADLRGQVQAAGESLEAALRAARVVVLLVLIWFGIASLGLLTQGWELLHRREAVQNSDLTVLNS